MDAKGHVSTERKSNIKLSDSSYKLELENVSKLNMHTDKSSIGDRDKFYGKKDSEFSDTYADKTIRLIQELNTNFKSIENEAGPSLSNISEENVFESLNITKIIAKTLSVKYEGYQYEFNKNDLHNFKPIKEGGYGKVFSISKTGRRYINQDKISADNSEGPESTRTTKFVIKCTKEFVDGGCNSGLEIKVLHDLAKLEYDMSPYLNHVALKGPHETQFFTIMKCYDYDLRGFP